MEKLQELSQIDGLYGFDGKIISQDAIGLKFSRSVSKLLIKTGKRSFKMDRGKSPGKSLVANDLVASLVNFPVKKSPKRLKRVSPGLSKLH